jgi:hypothetical protein
MYGPAIGELASAQAELHRLRLVATLLAGGDRPSTPLN